MRFLSDNTGTAAPEILASLADANHGLVSAYGNDPWTKRLDDCMSAYFGTQVRAFPVATGTAANSLSLATLTPSYGVIFAHEEAHIANDEAGAPGFFSGGAQLSLLQAPDGKITHAVLAAALEAHPVSLHTTQPTALALSQATELGTSYRPDELAALCKLAHERGLKVQMDGARFANAVAFLDCHPGDVTWRAGVLRTGMPAFRHDFDCATRKIDLRGLRRSRRRRARLVHGGGVRDVRMRHHRGRRRSS